MRHWSNIGEAGGFLCLKITIWLYRLLGRRITYFVMYFVMVYYFLVYSRARKASFKYIRHLEPKKSGLQLWIYSFKHFSAFGQMVIDKLAVWSKKITIKDIVISKQTRTNIDTAIGSNRGGVIFTAHFGNLEVARALSEHDNGMKINALVFNKHAHKFNDMLTKINPKYKIGMISIQDVTPGLAIELAQKVDNGEFIVIAGDRTSVTKPERNLTSEFLGETASFPQGAFILASILKCPAYFMLCPKKDPKSFELVFEKFDLNGIVLNRKDREKDLNEYAQKYTTMLEYYCKMYPTQWFNFFDFWNAGGTK